MQPAPAGRILKASTGDLTEVDVQGYRGFAPTADVEAIRIAKSRETPVRLLPTFDVYVTGTRPRMSFVDERFENGDEVERLGSFLDTPTELSFSRVAS